MVEPADISLILPAYNESARIESTIQQTADYFRSREYRYQIIVAADGNDGTREKVRRMGESDPAIQAIGHERRSGKGRGVREAAALCTGRIVGYADADNKVPISEFDKIAAKLKEGFPVVIGSRALSDSRVEKKQPLYRRIGSTGFRHFLHTVVGLKNVPDTQCGFKFFTRDAARLIFTNQQIDGYMFDVEILVLASRLGFELAQVPIRWQDDGDSRLELIAGNIRNLKDIFRIRSASAWATPAAVHAAKTGTPGGPDKTR